MLACKYLMLLHALFFSLCSAARIHVAYLSYFTIPCRQGDNSCFRRGDRYYKRLQARTTTTMEDDPAKVAWMRQHFTRGHQDANGFFMTESASSKTLNINIVGAVSTSREEAMALNNSVKAQVREMLLHIV